MTPAQCSAARALIELSQAALAGIAVVPATLIADYEAGAGTPSRVLRKTWSARRKGIAGLSAAM